jgi:hypothetical protein
MKFIELPIPVDSRSPEGYKPVMAYAKGHLVVVPIAELEDDDPHDCDWEGCGTLDHCVRFSVEAKYAIVIDAEGEVE